MFINNLSELNKNFDNENLLNIQAEYVKITEDKNLIYIDEFLSLNYDDIDINQDVISISSLYDKYIKMLKDLHLYNYNQNDNILYDLFKDYVVKKYDLKYVTISKDDDHNYHELYKYKHK